MIQGVSRIIDRVQLIHKSERETEGEIVSTRFVSKNKLNFFDELKGLNSEKIIQLWISKLFSDVTIPENKPITHITYSSDIHVPVDFFEGDELDVERFREYRKQYEDAEFVFEDDGRFICAGVVEKMSKSKFNVVNPDDVIAKYGADTFRMYEMFLGPVEMSKPWDTKGIEGVHRFLKKFWRLFVDEQKGLIVNDEAATNEELKVLHKTIRKIEEDTERFSFNTGVSAFMIATNELTDLKCHKRSILEPLVILLAPYAPHIAEELYQQLRASKVSPPKGVDIEGTSSVVDAAFP